ncbi:MarR family winged helix-turn-helix transcriptional regulator [Phaeobacter sp. B1627]|uniref:MarR family winged helix-turn-helix transcriptional regulator n=1 Tax=Phaeobacter sp. B1627 TaxID=2583809 RepID=UPI0011193B97|nr:MarR family transcriptional regulator [Phaeobacter sp. B1627]TNJ44470.1 MarR family transcriptional regulator [Phaeobacter sp. B1627]
MMQTPTEPQAERIKRRRLREKNNLFSRLPATYAASRLQGQRILQRASGLSIVEWRVLWDLSEAGPMTIRDLAEIQRIDHSQLSRALPAMRDKGYVTMARNGQDGRQVLVSLAPAGIAAYAQSAPVMKQRRDALKAAFTDEELKTFVGLLDRLEDFFRLPIDAIVESEPAQ